MKITEAVLRLTIVTFVAALVTLNAAEGARTPYKSEKRFFIGVCTHFSQNKGIVEMNLRSIKRAGINSIRDEVGWSSVEREKGDLVMPQRYDAYVRKASAAGLDVLLILDYSNRFYDDGDRPKSADAVEGFCRYAEFVVSHFGKDVRLYEIWNEWDIGIGLRPPYNVGGSPEDYVKLLKAVYRRIKTVDPDITVMGGGSTSGGVKKGWLEDILKLGALDYCDAVSIHSYNYSAKFPERSPETCSKWMAGVQNMICKYNGGKDVPFYVTEMGWPTHVGRRGTAPELSASYLARLYLLARTSPSFRGIWWYDFQNDGWNPEHNEHNFGLVRPDLTPKPGYHVMADISDLIADGRYVGRVDADSANLEMLHFKHAGDDVWAVWSSDDRDHQVILQTDSPSGELEIHQLGHEPYRTRWGFREWVGRSGDFVADRLSIVTGSRPVLISGNLKGASVSKTISREREAADKEKK
jgi:hypothetical protein